MRRRDPEAGAPRPAPSVSGSGDAASPTLQLTVPVSPPHHRDCFLFLREVSESVNGLGQEKEIKRTLLLLKQRGDNSLFWKCANYLSGFRDPKTTGRKQGSPEGRVHPPTANWKDTHFEFWESASWPLKDEEPLIYWNNDSSSVFQVVRQKEHTVHQKDPW